MKLGLLSHAQVVWFQRFLWADGRGEPLPFEIWTWALSRGPWDGYPNLATVTWPG